MRCVALLEREGEEDLEIGFDADRFDVHFHGFTVAGLDGDHMSVLIPMHRLLYIAQSLDETDDTSPKEYEN